MAVILSNRSWHENIFRILVTPNKAVKWVAGGAIFFLVLVLNVPFLLNLFLFEKVSAVQLLVCGAAGFSSIVWFEIYKALKNRHLKSAERS